MLARNPKKTFEQELLGSHSALYAYALSLTHNVTNAEDLLQGTILKALENKEQYKLGTSMRGWLIVIMRNYHRTMWRKNKRMIEDVDDKHTMRLVDPVTPERLLINREDLKMLDQLPERRGRIFRRFILGDSYAEIAEKEGCAIGTAKSQTHRARQRLGVR